MEKKISKSENVNNAATKPKFVFTWDESTGQYQADLPSDWETNQEILGALIVQAVRENHRAYVNGRSVSKGVRTNAGKLVTRLQRSPRTGAVIAKKEKSQGQIDLSSISLEQLEAHVTERKKAIDAQEHETLMRLLAKRGIPAEFRRVG